MKKSKIRRGYEDTAEKPSQTPELQGTTIM